MGDGGRAFGYVGALDGLRAFAVVGVLLFHSDLGVADGGFLGVSVFFTLSGFLITSLLLQEHATSDRIDLRAFYERRARRLLPAAHLCVAAVLACGVWWAATQRRDLPGDAIAAVANVANWRFAFAEHTYQDLFVGQPSPLAHFWSLAIEEQCYLLLPLVAAWSLRRGGRRRLGIVLGALLAASLASTWLTADVNLIYNGTHTRAAELLLGALLALAVRRTQPTGRKAATIVWTAVSAVMSVAGIALLVRLFIVADLQQRWLYRGGLPLVGVVSALTVVGLTGHHPVARLLGSRPFTALGRRSYGVYLFHWPIFLLLSPDRTGVHGWVLFALRMAATALVAALSYRFVEQPVRAASVLRGRRRVVLAGGAAAVALVAAATWAVPAPGFTRTEQLLALGDDGPITFGAAAAAAASDTQRAGTAPAESVPAVPAKVLVVGSDPNAAPILRLGGFEVVDGTQPGCPAAQAVAARMPDLSVVDLSACVPVGGVWPGLLQANSPDVVVLALGDVDAGLLRTAEDADFPAPDDVPNTARLLSAAEASLRSAVALLESAELPVVFWDRVVVGGERPIQRLALAASPPRPVLHTAEGLVDAVGAAAGGVSTAPLRVLVLGDSTSLDMAQALADAGAGGIVARWAGANGCPLPVVTATRSGDGAAWQPASCPDYAGSVRGLVAEFQPDAVLLVLGPTELQQHQYANDIAAHVAGDPVFVATHDAAMAALVASVGDAPLLMTDGPAVQVGPWATPAMAAPERRAAWNQQLARWDESFDRLTVLPYAAALAEYEFSHGSIRPDGVHPTVERLTELVGGWLLPQLQALAAPPIAPAPVVEPVQGDEAPADTGPLRVMVIGDSTSLLVARALADGSEGRLEVRWAGQEGCPFVPAVAARPAADSPWRTLLCRDVAAQLPRSLAEYRPQAVLLVVGAMELMEQRYTPNGPAVLPGSAAYRAAHDGQLDAVLKVLRGWGVPLLVADTPPLGVGSYSTFEMADPARAQAFNSMIGRWAAANDDVRVLAYGGAITDHESAHGSIRPDGSHPLLEQLTVIARSTLVPAVLDIAGLD